MKKVLRKWDILNKDKKEYCIRKIIHYFEKEMNEDLGIIRSGNILDFFMELLYEEIYNKAVEDSRQLLRERFDDFDIDLSLMLSK